MLCKWHDKRDVHIIATNDAGEDFVRQTRRNRQLIELSVPDLQSAHGRRRQAPSATILLRSGACRPALVEIPLLGYPQRRPHQRLHPVGRG